MRADRADEVDVPGLVLAADVVAAPVFALFQAQKQRVGVILDVKPVAHVPAVAVDRDRLARQRAQDHHRHQLLGEVVGAVVVRAVGQHDRQAIGLVPGADQVVGRGLGRRIGAARIVGRVLGELPGLAQRSEHLVGRDVVEAKSLGLALVRPVGAGGFQHVVGAVDVRLDERAGAVDRAVDVAFGGKVHHRVGPVPGKDAVQRRAVADVGMLERIAGAVSHRRHVRRVRGIGHRVQVHDLVPPRHRKAHHGRADEARPASHQNLHASFPEVGLKGDFQSSNGVAARSLSDRTGSATPQSMSTLSQRTAPSAPWS